MCVCTCNVVKCDFSKALQLKGVLRMKDDSLTELVSVLFSC